MWGNYDGRTKPPYGAGNAREGHSVTIEQLTAEKFCVELGGEIRRLRMRAGMSQGDLARLVGIHRNSLARYEAGADIPVMMFLRLCLATGSHAKDVLDRILGEDSGPAIRKANGL